MSSRTSKKKVFEGIEIPYVVQPFDVTILILYVDSVLEGKQYLIKKYDLLVPFEEGLDNISGGCYGKAKGSEDNLDYHYIIITKDSLTCPIIAHECMHAIFQIAWDKGMNLCEHSQEYYTYGVQHMMERIIDELTRLGVTINVQHPV